MPLHYTNAMFRLSSEGISEHGLKRIENGLKRISAFVVVLIIAAAPYTATAQKKLPSVDKIVDNYLKAVGGKKAALAIKDASYDWLIQFNNQPFGTARTQLKAPTAERWDLTFGNGQIVSAANASSAWEIGLDNKLRTLTALEAATAKLRASLDSSHLIDYKKANILARAVSLGDLGSDPAYIVEFSMRSGAKIQYYFNVKSGLLTKITSDSPKTRIVFEDYRRSNADKTILEPHRLRINFDVAGELTLLLQSVKYNAGIADNIFDPPSATEKLDVAELLREVNRNQDEIDNRVSEYAFTQKETEKELSDKGELKKQTVKVYEVFPLPNREPVKKLISENGVPLTAERASKEDKRVLEEFEKAERDREKDEKKVAQRRAEREKKEKEGTEISPFLKACEFISPRREQWEGRETIVFDFRPKPGVRPQNREESLVAKLVGVVWIDPVDKQVIRLEARLAEAFKIAGGLVASLKPGAAVIIEQTRMSQGVWLPRFAHVNLSIKVLLFGGGDYNQTIEWSDYKHFSGDVKDYKVDAPQNVKPQ